MLDPIKLRHRRLKAVPTSSELAARSDRDKRRAGITQLELADRCNRGSGKSTITPAQISRFETPAFIVDPHFSTVEKLAMALGCEIEDLRSPGTPDKRRGVKTQTPSPPASGTVPPPSEDGVGFT